MKPIEKMKEVDLVNISVKFSGDYVMDKFKTGRDIEKALVLNTVAHGYFMGVRFNEEARNEPKWKFWKKKVALSDEELIHESIYAAKAYIIEKQYQNLPFERAALIKATLGYGFKAGVRFSEKRDT